jgi:hypothetical protein
MAADAPVTPTGELLAAIGEAGLHLMEGPLGLARELAACADPADAVVASMRWSAARIDVLLADQARLMAAFLALAAPQDQSRGSAGDAPAG